MKTLTEYTQDAQTACFEKYGAFFAFSTEQFNKKKQDGVTYCQTGFGMLIPKDNVGAFTEEHATIIENGIKRDIEENGKEAIILRELANHECYYTSDITDCVEALDGYGFTVEDVQTVFKG